MSLSESDLWKAEEAHHRLQRFLYQPDQRQLDGALLCTAELLAMPDWNHAGLIDVTPERLPGLIDEAREFFTERERETSFGVTSYHRPPDLAQRLVDLGAHKSFQHSWLFYPPESPIERPTLPPGAELHQLTPADLEGDRAKLEAYVDLLFAAFGDIPRAYHDTIAHSLANLDAAEAAGVTLHHYLLTFEGRPAGTGTLLHDGHAGDLCNLGVHPELRRHGLGAYLTELRIHEARAAGCRLIFLQTKRDKVRRWQQRHGFELGFVIEGYTLP